MPSSRVQRVPSTEFKRFLLKDPKRSFPRVSNVLSHESKKVPSQGTKEFLLMNLKGFFSSV